MTLLLPPRRTERDRARPAGRTPGGPGTPAPQGRRPRGDADGMAVAAFVLGLVGLLVMNIVLGPAAVVLASLALLRGTTRRGRALLGLALGITDLVVLAAVVTAGGNVVWGFGS
ncbi:DUF4190 domain-containing protein [Streptomyces sp. C10-9-1]|uniref:DUF4190 domain-containing protein n=1 Tax=Streptomyces sp. C10-9-1 TaxID=1859285 RepID=UPI002112FEF3|nr:DUF4190 domain-containing protein [Streptomyces sp. C10-9-1]MCQ6552685.1 DUF4190 domain-containing protein [Streptomyces sp. C10-9-1]